ncbi:50S ribosomal protein L30 [Geobacter pickeringii]|uniref:50S ribosomal protein L30 n=1 Tax=Geobacter pickeringii TaxID=345632 RepID=UPI0009FEED8B|nr:50S ribosomal protein L30 [Geobacter pickeringii]
MSAEIKITLVRSKIGVSARQKAVLDGLGLTKCNKSVMLKATPEVLGMIAKVNHMVRVEE